MKTRIAQREAGSVAESALTHLERRVKETFSSYRCHNEAQPQVSNKLTMIDLFAGCGGLSLGFEQAGFTPLLYSEISPSASLSYIRNRQDLNVIPFGDIYKLGTEEINLLRDYWQVKYSVNDIDLVCGGPPCQGYSGIGHRRTFDLHREEIPSNHLYQEMIRVIRQVQPKIFLFENVKGLLSARWTKDGAKGEIFAQILREFRSIKGYDVHWELLYAKDYGLPQNRPRVIMVGIRHDILSRNNSIEPQIFDNGEASAVKVGVLPEPLMDAPTLVDVLDDLVDPEFPNVTQTTSYPSEALSDYQRLMRTMPNGELAKKGDPLTEQQYSEHSHHVVEKFKIMLLQNGQIPEHMKTKKFAQRVLPRQWGKSGPNITATSLPDDYVHYSQPRVPTVREWARLQSFPDWYQFDGPRTTGGRRRAGDPSIGDWEREVPKYTQIGNAVPVLLANAIAKHLRKILEGKR